VFEKVRYSKNVKPVIRNIRKMGFKLVAVSTGLQFMTERIKKELKFDHVLGNRLNTYRGRLTGGVTINISHGAKGKTMRKILKKFKIHPSEMIAVGDSEGDVPMIKIAGYSIAFNSSSEHLSQLVDHNCRSLDFREIEEKIMEISRCTK